MARTPIELPIDVDAETALLQSCLHSPSLFQELTELVSADDFGTPRFGIIWDVLVQCSLSNKPFDSIVIRDAIRVAGYGKDIVDAFEALDKVPAELDLAESWAGIVKNKALLRRLYSAAAGIANSVRKPDADGATALQEAETAVFQLGEAVTRDKLNLGEQLALALHRIETAGDGKTLGIPTGFRQLDEMTFGQQPGQFWLVAARPAMGKSSIAMQMAYKAALSGKVAYFAALEMDHSELLLRLISSVAGVDSRALASGNLSPEDLSLVRKTVQQLSELPLIIDDNPPDTIDGFRSAMKKLKRTQNVGWVGIDYVQLMYGSKRGNWGDNKEQEVSEISRGLKKMAREMKIPVIGLSQLSRNLESRADKRPMLSDLRQSGALEQDSDNVLFVYRESVYNAAHPAHAAELILAKQRSGPIGTIHLVWDAQNVRYLNPDHSRARQLQAQAPQAAPRF